MKIVLLGYMGSGKSTVGRQLALKRHISFTDLDDYIEAQLEMSISDIFNAHGEIFFRKKETEFLEEILSQEEDTVLALGGGTPCYGANMDLVLQHTSNVFYLRLSIAKLAQRLTSEKDHRPLIRHLPDIELPEFIGKHLFERTPFYNRATHILDADRMNEADLLAAIESKLV